jgi:hypothetical protein
MEPCSRASNNLAQAGDTRLPYSLSRRTRQAVLGSAYLRRIFNARLHNFLGSRSPSFATWRTSFATVVAMGSLVSSSRSLPNAASNAAARFSSSSGENEGPQSALKDVPLIKKDTPLVNGVRSMALSSNLRRERDWSLSHRRLAQAAAGDDRICTRQISHCRSVIRLPAKQTRRFQNGPPSWLKVRVFPSCLVRYQTFTPQDRR